MNKINWGIIGCGDVTELKSGPAFNKVKNSTLVAVMRRDGVKAKDYAQRHNVPKWHTDANQIINDPDINAIYVATPPSSHEEYTIASIIAGKPVYVEKPMSVNYLSAKKMLLAAKENDIKLVVAHYRRAQPLFKKIKELLDEEAIGKIRIVNLRYYKKPLSKQELADPKVVWRLNPEISGGGLFNDLAPHQLDLMIYFFGEIKTSSIMQSSRVNDDNVSGNILFKNDVEFNGSWRFNANENDEIDTCKILGTKGEISFAVFEHREISVIIDGKKEIFSFDKLAHVQQPMIEKVVDYFLDKSPNPCSAENGVEVMQLIEKFTGKWHQV